MGGQSLHKIMFSGPPFWAPKGPRGLRGPRPWPGAPKMGPGVKNIKVAGRKTMQNPLVNAPNGAICCKLWSQTMSGVGPKIWGGKLVQIWGANWFKSETLGPSKLCDGSPKSRFSHFGKSGKFGTQFGSIWGAMGSKMASIWRLRSHVKSRAVSRSLQGAA